MTRERIRGGLWSYADNEEVKDRVTGQGACAREVQVWAVLEEIIHGKRPGLEYRGLTKGGQFFMNEKRILMRRDVDESEEAQRRPVVVLPRQLIPVVLAQYHEGASHLGRRKTLQLCRRVCFWRGMEKDVERHVRGCRECMLVKQNAKQSKGFQVGTRPTRFMENVYIDTFGPIAASLTGNRYVLTIYEQVS